MMNIAKNITAVSICLSMGILLMPCSIGQIAANYQRAGRGNETNQVAKAGSDSQPDRLACFLDKIAGTDNIICTNIFDATFLHRGGAYHGFRFTISGADVTKIIGEVSAMKELAVTDPHPPFDIRMLFLSGTNRLADAGIGEGEFVVDDEWFGVHGGIIKSVYNRCGKFMDEQDEQWQREFFGAIENRTRGTP